jgi:predicted Zn-dependent protease with MMP-like domain
MSIDDKVEHKVNKCKEGIILLSEDFHDLGNAGAVKIALYRLVNKGQLKRLSRGIFVKPRYNELVGEVIPTAEEVAIAIANRDKARIMPTGAFAMNILGLSTQVPLKLVYLTDGSPRKITIGKRTIQFKKTSPKNLSLKGKISRLIVQAIREIGQDNATEEELHKILELLKKEDPKTLKHDISLAPQWVGEIMAKAL